MAEKSLRRGGKKNRKHGRRKGKPSQKRYVAEGRSAKNKERKIRKHKKRHPNWTP
jgi:hypothetical protein